MESHGRERRGGQEGPNQIPPEDEKIIVPVTDDKRVPKPEAPIPREDLDRILREQGGKRKYENAGNN